MKKTISIILISLILLITTGCDSQGGNVTYSISFGNGLPTYKSSVKFKEVELTDELINNNATNMYVFDDSSKLTLYRLENSDSSIEEIMKKEIANYPSDYELEYTELDEWDVKGDSHYGYYMSYEPTGYDRPYYFQNFFFKSGNDIIKAQFWLPAIRMNLPISGWTIDLPLGYEDGSLIKTEITDDAVAKYIPSLDTEYPELNIYKWENVYSSLKDYAENELSDLYDMNNYEIRSYTDINGNNHNILLSIYDEDDEGRMETNFDYTFDLDSEYIEFDFFVDQNDDYVRFAIPALAASIASNK